MSHTVVSLCPYDVEAEAPLRRQVHDAKLENEELRRLLETEQRRRREGTDKYQAISEQLHAAREETSQEVRLRKEIEAEVAGLHAAVAGGRPSHSPVRFVCS